jgi:mannitol-1-/sugar-/sorbitol-6-phosphatase
MGGPVRRLLCVVEFWRWSGAAVLFDMDGTLVESGASVLRAWRWTAAELGLPFALFEPYLHGIPADQVLERVAANVAAELRASVVAEMLARQSTDTDGVVAVPGAAAALAVLRNSRWAVVTSADQALAESRIRAAGLTMPCCLVTAELTSVGKPAPDPYLYAARELAVSPTDCLVVEDSAAGVESGRAAGCRVLGLRTSSTELTDADCVVNDLTAVEFAAVDDGVSVRARSNQNCRR